MEHVQFGRTGLRVSQLCLGTMTFGLQIDEAASVEILDTALEAGISFIDTADIYPNGHDGDGGGVTEEIIGRWLVGKRDRVILATKFFAPMGPDAWNMGGSRKHIMDAVEASLRRLNTDYLDLYQIHFWDHRTPIDETLGALDDLVRSGKVRYLGASNYQAWQLATAIGRSEARHLIRYDCVQPRYNLLFRNIERDILPLAEYEGLAVIPYNPLAGGFLTGKHRPETGPTEGTRFTMGSAGERYQERYWNDDKFAMVEKIRPLAEAAGMTMPQLAMAWVLANPVVTSAIVGATRALQLADAVAAVENPMPADLKAELDDLTARYRLVEALR